MPCHLHQGAGPEYVCTVNRGSIPAYAMNPYGRDELRQEGIVVVSHDVSWSINPDTQQPHYHDFFQVLLVVGPARLMHDFRDYDLDGVTVIFVSPGQIHTMIPKPGMHGTQVSFTQDFFDHKSPPPSQLFEMPFFFPAETAPMVSVPESHAGNVSRVFAGLQDEFDAARPDAADALRALLNLMCVLLGRVYKEVHPTRQVSRADQLIREFQLAVELHFKDMKTVKDYAQFLKVTPNHLNDVVRERTGHSAGEIIRQRQVLNVKRLLLHSDLSVSEIGYQMGFKDPSYFSRFFRRAMGTNPADFRAEIREKYQSTSS